MSFDKIIDGYREDIIQSTRDLIRIKSVEDEPLPGKPFGEGVDRALSYALDLSSKLGFRTKNIDGYAGYAEFGQGDETLGILVHLDVVPEGNGWRFPPYGGEIHGGRIYGRGAIDDKGPAIGALYAMKAVMDSGVELNKKVRMIFGTDEESGWEDMKVFFDKEPMPDMGLSPDGDYPVINAEKGILSIVLEKRFERNSISTSSIELIKGGHRPNMVPDECCCTFTTTGDMEKIISHLNVFESHTECKMKGDYSAEGKITIHSYGKSAHGSTPEKGENAISNMLEFLTALGLGHSDMERFINIINNKLAMETRGRELGIEYKDDASGSLTVNLGMIEVNKTMGTCVINIRYPVTITMEEVMKKIEEAFEGTGISLRVVDHIRPLYVPEEDKLVKTLKKVYKDITGNDAKAIAIGGGTYARAIKNAVAFGAQFPGTPELAHQKDEYIDIEELIMHAKIYARAIYELAGVK